MARPKPAISLAEARAVFKHYGLGQVMFVRAAAGTANPAVVVVTQRGEFFLKRRNPRYASRSQLLYDHAVIRHLAAAGLPVYPAIRTLTQSRWLEQGGHIYEVYPLISGQAHRPGEVSQVEAAGCTLGRLHLATAQLRPPGSKPLAGRLFDPKARLSGLHWALKEVKKRGSEGQRDAERVRALMALAETIDRRLPDEAYWSLPQCIVHGDYHPANLLFDGDEVIGLFDFDWVMAGPRMVDVADGLIFFCGRRQRPIDPSDIRALTQAFRLDPDLMTAFGRGYGSVVTPEPHELRALPDLMRARWLYSRLDAMERKVPEAERVDYLLHEIEVPLEEVDRHQQMIASGSWLRPISRAPAG